MSRFRNSKQEIFISSISTISLEEESNDTASRCKFNFSFMDFSQTAGQKFQDWKEFQLVKLMDKLKGYSRKSLEY